jgi:hypothetical protein
MDLRALVARKTDEPRLAFSLGLQKRLRCAIGLEDQIRIVVIEHFLICQMSR